MFNTKLRARKRKRERQREGGWYRHTGTEAQRPQARKHTGTQAQKHTGNEVDRHRITQGHRGTEAHKHIYYTIAKYSVA